jgi:asparagine synthase (glutamine-hydrolysing)
LEQLLGGAIRTQMLADVPVGAFLSGGTDSSTVVALMQSQSSARVKTFNIGFWDAALDESSYAARVAAHLGTDHTTLRCGDAELLELAREVGAIYCEPFADDAQIPTLALARLARQQVTVSLSGDGGDEVFRGYGRYVRTLRRWRQLQRYPAVRFGVRCGLDSLSWAADLLTESPLKRRMNCKLQKARNQWLAQHLPAYYRHRNSVVKNPDLFLRAPKPLADFFDDTGRLPQMKENVSWLSYLDMNTYLPDHVLVRVDRAAMAFGLETRMPLLDHRVVEYLATASEGLLRQDGKSKWPLRSLLARNIPLDLVERPKMGFSAPMTVWLRGPLREWAEDHLSPERLNRNDFFDGREVRRCWAEHQQGRKNHPLLLWNLLVFQAWHSSWN